MQRSIGEEGEGGRGRDSPLPKRFSCATEATRKQQSHLDKSIHSLSVLYLEWSPKSNRVGGLVTLCGRLYTSLFFPPSREMQGGSEGETWCNVYWFLLLQWLIGFVQMPQMLLSTPWFTEVHHFTCLYFVTCSFTFKTIFDIHPHAINKRSSSIPHHLYNPDIILDGRQ